MICFNQNPLFYSAVCKSLFMWVAKFKVWHRGSEAIEITRRMDVSFESHYLNVYLERGVEYVNKALIARGSQAKEAIAAFAVESKKRGLKLIATEGNHVFFVAKGVQQFHSTVLGAKAFFVGPQWVKNGFLYWTVASWNKKNLKELYTKISRLPKDKVTIELLSLRKQPAATLGASLLGALSEKQLQALESACQSGYFKTPRKISLENLAKKNKLPYTTFKDRLRAAEEKLWAQVMQGAT